MEVGSQAREELFEIFAAKDGERATLLLLAYGLKSAKGGGKEGGQPEGTLYGQAKLNLLDIMKLGDDVEERKVDLTGDGGRGASVGSLVLSMQCSDALSELQKFLNKSGHDARKAMDAEQAAVARQSGGGSPGKRGKDGKDGRDGGKGGKEGGKDGKEGARGAKDGIAPWRGAGANDDQLRIKLVDVELNGEGVRVVDELKRKQRLSTIETLQLEVDIAGLTSRDSPLLSERLNLYDDGHVQPLAFEKTFATSPGSSARKALLAALATPEREDSDVYVLLHAVAPAGSVRGATSRGGSGRGGDEEVRRERGEDIPDPNPKPAPDPNANPQPRCGGGRARRSLTATPTPKPDPDPDPGFQPRPTPRP